MNLDIGHTRAIITLAKIRGLLRNELAYVLATAYWETARSMMPIKETVMLSHKDKNPSDATVKSRLTTAWKRGRLPWVRSDYWSGGFFGRGYVQLTHKANYEKAGRILGVDMVSDPTKALDPQVAQMVLVRGMQEGWFTGKKLSDYITISKSDFVGARRIINGTDKAAEIAAIAEQYDDALLAEGYGIVRPDVGPAAPPPPAAMPAWLAAIIALFTRGRK